jgi:hypothetical protein
MNNIKRARLLALAAAGATAALGFSQQMAHAQSGGTGPAINVVVGRGSDGDGLTGDAANLGAAPATYTPSLATIAAAPGVKYDAADMDDSGTQWNVLLCPPTQVQVNGTGAIATVVFQKNLPLADSSGAATQVKLDLLYLESNNKSNGIHTAGLPNEGAAGKDGLEPNPEALIKPSWIVGSTSDKIEFQLTGLTPNGTFDLYIYGAGKNGNGGSFTLADTNQGTGYNSADGAYTTESTKGSVYHSVFASGGTDPKPEEGKSWVVLPAAADAGGNLIFFVEHDHGTKLKGSINGFQLQPVTPPTSGPTTTSTTVPATAPGMSP